MAVILISFPCFSRRRALPTGIFGSFRGGDDDDDDDDDDDVEGTLTVFEVPLSRPLSRSSSYSRLRAAAWARACNETRARVRARARARGQG